MSKKVILVIVIVLILFGSGLYVLTSKNIRNNESNNSNVKDSLFTSVKDAIGKKLTLSCEFENEGLMVKTYIKNGEVRVSSQDKNGSSSEYLQKDGKMYMWDTKSKQGFISSVTATDSTQTTTNQDLINTKNYIDLVDEYKDSCKVTDVNDTYFTVPNDIVFKDLDEFMKEIQSQIPKTPSN